MKANTNSNFFSPRSSISDSINNALSPTADGINDTSTSSNIAVLGVKWDTDRDVFGIDVLEKIVRAPKEPVTKRLLLKLISNFYDPLGIFTPVTVIVKILFQDTWLSGIQWNELLPPAVAQQWQRWLNELQCLNNIHIRRWIDPSHAVTMHVFCDASVHAYGACL
ncbi:hypothetical protein HNY73_019341 [Argiope bruennichi]|uniref:Uncharacterized protein n=1 Tax=Argiope bruennichi TaxID=94029 RepID=A0A8T0EH00_ARGBR|nr:hypothetical protein HNY73_019341 [Argiope bruennichi]